ncbi:MAG: diacylglyceryl transferase [Terrimonas sp.]|nr:diacylglyceryl transferase [Terrimonas sp.]
MYPNLYYAFRDLFGVELPFLRFVNSFGFFVALSFILAAFVLTLELKRKSKQGFFKPTEIDVMVGKPATQSELLLNFVLGFILGYKILGLFIMSKAATNDPQAFIFSGIGSWPAGIILGFLFAGLKWWEKNKQKLPKPEQRKIRIWPQDRVGEITIIALVFGLLGAKLFDIFENWSDFLKHPSSYIFSPAGLTFYGGLICATIAIWWYARKNNIGILHLSDAAAPALMLSYSTGRIGCQVAGDGDWGIHNSAYGVDAAGTIFKASPEQFTQAIQENAQYFTGQFGGLDKVPHLSVAKPHLLNFLPDWMFAFDFPHNVNEEGVKLANCLDDKYCAHLPIPVFPTPFYETLMCLALFGILWAIRKKLKVPGTIFSIYLIMNGIERFFIEKIRVNNRLDIFGFQPTQAEVISSLLVLTGLLLFYFLTKRSQKSPA